MFSKGKTTATTTTTNETTAARKVPDKPAVPSILSTDMRIVGDLVSEGEIQIDGTIEGDIRSKKLLVGEPASITGEVIADTVEVFGSVTGQIKARSVILAKTAHVIGDIHHEDLSIEKGAFLEGHCKRMTEKMDFSKGTINLVTKDRDAKPAQDSGKPVSGSGETPKLATNG